MKYSVSLFEVHQHLVEIIYVVAKFFTGVYGGCTWISLGCLEFLYQLTTHDKNNSRRNIRGKETFTTKYKYTMSRQTP